MIHDAGRAYLKAPVGAAPLPGERPLAVLIVTYKSHSQLETCLAGVAEHLPELPVYVYENSGDEYPGREELAARYPDVHWVFGKVNLGLAAAFNALVEHVPPQADLLELNPDARLLGPLTRTRELLRQPGVAVVAPLNRDIAGPGPKPWDIATRRPTLMRSLVAATGYAVALRGTPLSQLYADQPAETECVSGYMGGGCLAFSRAAWNAIGGFDEEFFLYGEDADWQARARRAGWKLLLADELGIDHGDPVGDEGVHGLYAVPEQGGVSVERRRNQDLYRANTALVLEHERGVRRSYTYLAGTTALDRLQPAKRRARRAVRPDRRGDRPAVVITTNMLCYGGAERQKVALATELDRRGYPVTLVCLKRFGPLIREIPHSIRVLRQPWWLPALDLPQGPSVLIGSDTNTETGFATLWRAAGTGRRWLLAAHTPPEQDRPIYSRPLAAAMSRADGFIVLAQRHWEMLTAQHRLRGGHFVVPNGIAVPDEPPVRLRVAGRPPHLVMLSRIVEHKNPQVLMEALEGLADLPWTLSIFGDGPDRERLQARTPAALHDRVHWRGWSAGPGPALADADLLCVPSRSEAFPMAIIEAMARAVPVAASAICAVPEMLGFGEAGFVVEQPTVAVWRETLAGILAEPERLPVVGQSGFERVRAHYSVEAMTDAYLDSMEAVL